LAGKLPGSFLIPNIIFISPLFCSFLPPFYQQLAINETNSLHRLPKHLIPVKEEFVYRSYLALGQYDIILGEINENNPNTSIGSPSLSLASHLSPRLL
jgi:hypothetical protein